MDEPLDQLVSSPPLLHTWDKGGSWNTGGFDGTALERLHRLTTGAGVERVLETGAGCSTLAFILSGVASVTSVFPDAGLAKKIGSWLDDRGVTYGEWEPVLGMSEDVLPDLTQPGTAAIDLALIDGGHGWPTVFVDFYYMNRALRQGGLLVVDDLQLYGVAELARLLSVQPGWSYHSDVSPKTAVFRKNNSDARLPDFGGQPYIRLRSNLPGARSHLTL
jgi:hypothetical protein